MRRVFTRRLLCVHGGMPSIVTGRPQKSYPNGSMMCTSASVCMAVAAVTHALDVSRIDAGQISSVMHLAARAQGKAERVLARGPGVALGVTQMIVALGADMQKVGVALQELVILGDTPATALAPCLITLECLPERMLRGGDGTVACILTCNGHSTCVMSSAGGFALFDPGPSYVIMGLTGKALLLELAPLVGGAEQCDATILHALVNPHL